MKNTGRKLLEDHKIDSQKLILKYIFLQVVKDKTFRILIQFGTSSLRIGKMRLSLTQNYYASYFPIFMCLNSAKK